jgi:hypothetical protein
MSFFGFGKKDNLEDELFNLKFASKQQFLTSALHADFI